MRRLGGWLCLLSTLAHAQHEGYSSAKGPARSAGSGEQKSSRSYRRWKRRFENLKAACDPSKIDKTPVCELNPRFRFAQDVLFQDRVIQNGAHGLSSVDLKGEAVSIRNAVAAYAKSVGDVHFKHGSPEATMCRRLCWVSCLSSQMLKYKEGAHFYKDMAVPGTNEKGKALAVKVPLHWTEIILRKQDCQGRGQGICRNFSHLAGDMVNASFPAFDIFNAESWSSLERNTRSAELYGEGGHMYLSVSEGARRWFLEPQTNGFQNGVCRPMVYRSMK